MLEDPIRVCHLKGSSHQCHATSSGWGGQAYLRDPFGSNEGASFDVCQPSLCEPLNQVYLRRQRDRLLLILQSISRPDLDNLDVVAGGMMCVFARLIDGGIGRCGQSSYLTDSQTATAAFNKRS